MSYCIISLTLYLNEVESKVTLKIDWIQTHLQTHSSKLRPTWTQFSASEGLRGVHVHRLVAKVLKMHKSGSIFSFEKVCLFFVWGWQTRGNTHSYYPFMSCSKEKRFNGNSDALLRILSDSEFSVINRGFSVRLVIAYEKYNLLRKKTSVNTR